MSVAITGASGFVGGRALRRLTGAGQECVTLGRRPVTPDVEHRAFDLGAAVPAATWAGVDTLLHCAWDLTAVAPRQVYQRNVVGSLGLLRSAAAAGVRVVFVSSMSAYAGTRQLYGRSKLEVEREVRELGGVSLRLGLVWGTDAGGMAGAVQKLTALPVVPVLGRGSYQFTAFHEDVDRAVQIAVTEPLTGVIGVAHPDRVPLPQLLTGLAALGGHTVGRLVTMPWQPFYWAMRVAEALKVPLPLRSDSMLGLVRPAPHVPAVDTWHSHGLELVEFSVDAAPR